MHNVTINQEQSLYVFDHGGGYSCWGFENAFLETQELATRLGRRDLLPSDEEVGTLSILDKHHELIALARDVDLGTWFSPKTPQKVREVIEEARRSGRRIRLFTGNIKTGQEWFDEFDVIGTVGRSTGTLKVPLLIANRNSTGGPAILTDCIVKIMDVETKRVLYVHPKHRPPQIEIRLCDREVDGYSYSHEALVNGDVHARFKSEKAASNWRGFMLGERMRK